MILNSVSPWKGSVDLVERTVQSVPDDDMLMAQIADGNLVMLGELYLRHRRMVHGAVRRFAPSISEAQIEELGQDIFMLLHKKAGSYRSRGKFRSFLYGIAVKKARTWQRNFSLRCRILGNTPPEMLVGAGGMQPCPAERAALRETVLQVLARLPGRQRDVLVLHAVEGFSCDEISEILGVSPKTVRTRLFRARQALLDNVNKDNWVHALQREAR
ncbi:MAG: RNA polymerase sigma factor [Deltaproteobacteria bacterium]|nr:RNA polymerase sigma factor [Deltaproteobacteria bacterium]MBN2671125.1 RNA polymerase sigma factor [Deltaproteobacteria bacterium]